jgi:hypothetical protein
MLRAKDALLHGELTSRLPLHYGQKSFHRVETAAARSDTA